MSNILDTILKPPPQEEKEKPKPQKHWHNKWKADKPFNWTPSKGPWRQGEWVGRVPYETSAAAEKDAEDRLKMLKEAGPAEWLDGKTVIEYFGLEYLGPVPCPGGEGG